MPGLFFGVTLNAQLPAPRATVHVCAKELKVPLYNPGPIWQAQLSGTASVRITIKGAKAESVTVTGVHEGLGEWIKTELSESVFNQVCDAMTIEMTLTYRLEGRRARSPISEVRYLPPNDFIITARPPIIEH